MTRAKAFEILDKFPRCVECDASDFPYQCNDCDEAFYKALQELKKPYWISAKEQLPEVNLEKGLTSARVWCIVAFRHSGGYSTYPMLYEKAIVRGKEVERWLYPWGKIYGGDNLYYWQNLPEPPEDGEQ